MEHVLTEEEISSQLFQKQEFLKQIIQRIEKIVEESHG